MGVSRPVGVLLVLVIQVCLCIEFHRTTTGVKLTPNIRYTEKGTDNPTGTGWWSYTLQDVKAMMEKISSKFSMITTYGVGAIDAEYVPEKSYYNSSVSVFCAEAAALVNQDRNANAIAIVIGIWQHNSERQTKNEIHVALESARKANNIYPETASGVVFSHGGNGVELNQARKTLRNIQTFKHEIHRFDLKIGVRQSCHNIGQPNELGRILKIIVKESDFIICEVYPSMSNSSEEGFKIVENDMNTWIELMNKIKPGVDVRGETGWASKGDSLFETPENMVKYWQTVDNWASETGVKMYMFEAFDNSWKTWAPNAAHFGWWKLKRNADIRNMDSYIEKIEETTLQTPKQEFESTTGVYDSNEESTADASAGYRAESGPHTEETAQGTITWIFIGVSVGLIVVFIFPGLTCVIFSSTNKMKKSYSPN